MPIDASSDSFDGSLGPEPAATKASIDPDLGAAGTGASKGGFDFEHVEKSAPVNPKADLDLDDAGRGAKVDPSLKVDPELPANKTGLGGALDQVDHSHDSSSGVKDVDFGAKHVDIGADHDHGAPHDDHIKGLHGVDDLHHDDHDHAGHDHGHDDHIKGLHGVDHHDAAHDHHH